LKGTIRLHDADPAVLVDEDSFAAEGSDGDRGVRRIAWILDAVVGEFPLIHGPPAAAVGVALVELPSGRARVVLEEEHRDVTEKVEGAGDEKLPSEHRVLLGKEVGKRGPGQRGLDLWPGRLVEH